MAVPDGGAVPLGAGELGAAVPLGEAVPLGPAAPPPGVAVPVGVGEAGAVGVGAGGALVNTSLVMNASASGPALSPSIAPLTSKSADSVAPVMKAMPVGMDGQAVAGVASWPPMHVECDSRSPVGASLTTKASWVAVHASCWSASGKSGEVVSPTT